MNERWKRSNRPVLAQADAHPFQLRDELVVLAQQIGSFRPDLLKQARQEAAPVVRMCCPQGHPICRVTLHAGRQALLGEDTTQEVVYVVVEDEENPLVLSESRLTVACSGPRHRYKAPVKQPNLVRLYFAAIEYGLPDFRLQS